MRKTTAVGNVGNRHVDKTPTTAGTRVAADFMNDVQDELMGIQDSASIAEAAGTNEYVLAAMIYNIKRHGREIGELIPIPGNVKAPTEFDKDDPTSFFPAICLTDFDTHTVVDGANWGTDYIDWLRDQNAVYNEGRTGEAGQFAGNAAGSVITLTDNAANNSLLATLYAEAEAHVEEMGGDETDFLTITWDGTEYVLADDGSGYPDIDTVTREITVTGTPTAGAGNMIVYPHRIAGSTTTARVYSLRGRALVGAGYDGVISGFRRRDRMQGHWHKHTYNTGQAQDIGAGGWTIDRSPTGSGSNSTSNKVQDAVSDGTNGTPRTGTTTHGMDVGTHIYQHAGVYIA